MTAIITLADANRADHVTRQAHLIPDGVEHIVIALADADELAQRMPSSCVIPAPQRNLALARNTGAREAIRSGHKHLMFLDADCLPGPQLVDRYRQALAEQPEAVVAGPVTYLPEGEIRTDDPQPHAARPNPPAGQLEPAEDYNLFWSLSFALTADTWGRIEGAFGGFDTGFTGYGGEDTDFAWNLRKHGIALFWVGGAHAYHQWHPVSSPPWEHLDDILRNAAYFHSMWGAYPMEGWLRAFEKEGAVALIDGSWQRL